MTMIILCLSFIFFAVALYLEGIWIRVMRYLRIGEAIKDYGPQEHKKKRGTPGMGGIVVFLLAPVMAYSAYYCDLSGAREMFYIWSFPLMAGLVGLTDDILKCARKSSEGLASLQKLLLQTAVSSLWVYMIRGRGIYVIPSFMPPLTIGAPLLVFICVGALNAVNVTDGLDGLAGSAIAVSLLSMFLWADNQAAIISAAFGLSAILAFLWHNANPAMVFMGDVGSHFWGGLLVSLCMANRSLIFIIPTTFIFGIELVTSAVQIAAIRGFGRKVFRMSPLHHHFELAGMKEPTIVSRFTLAHLVGAVAAIILIKTVLGGGLRNV
ncbi:MAG: phospho-N-acetylmuramoyl-pentapeptide-transferase [Synergistaceae bacterium]|jgi:phospho-N-acetylmuramoyl-pentapeptide-transferase|nr:phospho-N-acetylmuramoyl-pentapeptide-transferase [Synergistaceae bacterium]